MWNRFRDREDAGRQLAHRLRSKDLEQPIVVALPRGGVPVGYEIARALSAPLDVWIARKVGVPWQPELGLGAVAEGGHLELNEDVVRRAGLTERELDEAIEAERRHVEARVIELRGRRDPPDVGDRTVIVVDDGIATGGTARAALRSIRAQSPRRVILAVPVAPAATVRSLEAEVDEVVCLNSPDDFQAIGLWYDDFSQVTDREVARLLADASAASPAR